MSVDSTTRLQEETAADQEETVAPKDLYSPVLTGYALRLFALLSSCHWVQRKLLHDNGFNRLLSLNLPPTPTFVPLVAPSDEDRNRAGSSIGDLPDLLSAVSPAHCGQPIATCLDYHKAYKDGTVTPLDVAKRVVEVIKTTQSGEHKMNFFITWAEDEVLRIAKESTDRYAAGCPVSVLDGVPVAVKDEVAMLPFPTTLGTLQTINMPTADAFAVQKLRDAGAMLLGKTTMTEIGASAIGENIHYGWPRNPYNTNHSCSGSSSGSAGAVAAGLCPLAVGCDGGGSIRMPAAVCGVVGLKCTYGRVSTNGVIPLCPTLGHCGPLGATVQDVAAAYQIMGGSDSNDVTTTEQPPVSLHGLGDTASMASKTIGVCWKWFEACDQEVVDICKAAVDRLAAATGMDVVEVAMPLLEETKLAQTVVIVSEMRTAMAPFLAQAWSGFSPYTRAMMNLGSAFSAHHYIAAQYVRHQAMRDMKRIFSTCSVMVTPSCGYTAPRIRPSAEAWGVLDAETTGRMMRFAGLGNLTGVPGLSVPAGYSKEGLPVGLQIMGPWWSEMELLRLGYALEKTTPRQQPVVFYEPLKA